MLSDRDLVTGEIFVGPFNRNPSSNSEPKNHGETQPTQPIHTEVQGANNGVLISSINLLKQYQEQISQAEALKESAFTQNKDLTELENKIVTELRADPRLAEQLTPEELAKIDSLTGRERVGALTMIWTTIEAAQKAHTQVTGQSHVNIHSVLDKLLTNPINSLAIGNIICNSIDSAKDGLTVPEVLSITVQGGIVLTSLLKIVDSFVQADVNPAIPGSTFRERLSNYYRNTESVNVITKVDIPHTSLNVNLDVKDFSLTPFANSDIAEIEGVFRPITPDLPGTSHVGSSTHGNYDLSNIMHSPEFTNTNPIFDGIGGHYRPLNPDVPSHVPSTHPMPHGGGPTNAHVIGALGVATDIAWVGSAIANLVESGEDWKPSQICDLIGAVLVTAGDVASFAGPLGEVVGLIISGIGTLTASIGSIADLNSNSSPKEVGMAVGDFFSALVPLIPSARLIDQAVQYENLADSATDDVHRILYQGLHRLASLDATPLINLTHKLYEGEIKQDIADELMDEFKTFDNMMTYYIKQDSELGKQLTDVANFLKNNAHTEHTQFITAYLTPQELQTISKNFETYREGYDIRNVDSTMYTLSKDNTNNLVMQKGLSVLPLGKNLSPFNGREILDTISLGYGKGRTEITDGNGHSVRNPRIIDTATRVSYTKQQLEMFIQEFRRQHTTRVISHYTGGGMLPGGVILGKDPVYVDVQDPRFENFKCWLDLNDDLSGKTVNVPFSSLKADNSLLSLVSQSDRDRFIQLNTNLVDAEINYSMEKEFIASDAPLFNKIISSLFTNPHGTLIEAQQAFNNASAQITIGDINNRVISTISDVVHPNVNTGKGNDDVIFSDTVRGYTGSNSVLRAKADGGEGTDLLDISNITIDSEFNYLVKDKTFTSNKLEGNGADFDYSFTNFEQINLTKGNNVVKASSDVALQDGDVPDILHIVATLATKNEIDFSGIHGVSLNIQGSVDGNNVIHSSENNDVITIPNRGDAKGTGTSEIFGMGGNDFISVSSGKNTIHGGDGTDYIKSTSLQDVIYGDAGNDILESNTKMYGGSGNDTLIWGSQGKAGTILEGEEGTDIYTFKDDFTNCILRDNDGITDVINFTSSTNISSLGQLEIMTGTGNNLVIKEKSSSNIIEIENWSSGNKMNLMIGTDLITYDNIDNIIAQSASSGQTSNQFFSQLNIG